MRRARLCIWLEEMGHEVLTRHLVSDNAWEADRSISPQDVYRRDMAWLEQCDLFIAEVSGSSFGLGFETGLPVGRDQQESRPALSTRRATEGISSDYGKYARELHVSPVRHRRRSQRVYRPQRRHSSRSRS